MPTIPRKDIFLHPGDYFVGDAAHRLATLLGSCVSVTLWHPVKRIGAMSHFVLAERASRGAGPLDARYGREAMELIVIELKRRGIRPEECQAKLFGGFFPNESANTCSFVKLFGLSDTQFHFSPHELEIEVLGTDSDSRMPELELLTATLGPNPLLKHEVEFMLRELASADPKNNLLEKFNVRIEVEE